MKPTLKIISCHPDRVKFTKSFSEDHSVTMILFILTALLLAPLAASPAADAPRPNVLMIIADDLNDWVGCLNGHPDVKTPNLDRLARRGLLFANAHCAAPVCNPSRVATFTGRRPSSSGVYSNDTVWHEVMPGVPTIPQHFKANGYFVAGGGKVYHHPPGFNRRSDWTEYFDQVFDGHYQAQWAKGEKPKTFTWPAGFPLNQLPRVKALTPPPLNPNEFDWGEFDKSDSEMGDGQMVEWAAEFLKQQPRQPFFLAAGIYRPHLPWYAPRKYFEMYPANRVTPGATTMNGRRVDRSQSVNLCRCCFSPRWKPLSDQKTMMVFLAAGLASSAPSNRPTSASQNVTLAR